MAVGERRREAREDRKHLTFLQLTRPFEIELHPEGLINAWLAGGVHARAGRYAERVRAGNEGRKRCR